MYIVAESLTKRYGKVFALQNCSLSTQKGEIFGLLGPNGAGKTTLLRILLGYLRPTSGKASIDSIDCAKDSLRVRERVSYLPGDPRLFRRMRGRDVLRFFARLRGQKNASHAMQLAERLRLDTSRKVAAMSTGMRQKLALAVTLAVDVPLLILDEPTSNLDPSVRSEVQVILNEAKANGKTVLFSSHVLSEVEEICDRIAIMKNGTHVQTLTLQELLPWHRIRARLMGKCSPLPVAIQKDLTKREQEGRVEIETHGDLAPLLGWLAEQPLADVRIQPIGLKKVYEQFHPANEAVE